MGSIPMLSTTMKPYALVKRYAPATLKDFMEWNPKMSIASLKKVVIEDRKAHEKAKIDLMKER